MPHIISLMWVMLDLNINRAYASSFCASEGPVVKVLIPRESCSSFSEGFSVEVMCVSNHSLCCQINTDIIVHAAVKQQSISIISASLFGH